MQYPLLMIIISNSLYKIIENMLYTELSIEEKKIVDESFEYDGIYYDAIQCFDPVKIDEAIIFLRSHATNATERHVEDLMIRREKVIAYGHTLPDWTIPENWKKNFPMPDKK